VVEGDKGKTTVEALFDMGASGSFIRKKIAENQATVERLPRPWRFIQGDGKNEITIRECINGT
jgi:hypothetical protein